MSRRKGVLWGLLIGVNLFAVALGAWLWIHTRHWYQLLGAVNLGCAAFLVWRLLWDLQRHRTSKSSPPSRFQSNSLVVGLSPSPSPPSAPRPSPSLPRITVDQPIIGYRQWRVASDGLHPRVSDVGRWDTVTRAFCANEGNHSVPDLACSCGLYAYFDASPALAGWPEAGVVYGAVLASGRIVRHPTEGIRAETMRILALARPPLKENRPDPCPKAPEVSAPYLPIPVVTIGRAASMTSMAAFHYGHNFKTEHRSLHLSSGLHHYQAKLYCEWCGCGPEREFVEVDHAADLQQLEALAATYGVPVIPVEHLEAYASEFGLVATEVRQVTA